MKHLKTFENLQEQETWEMPTSEKELLISLYKLGMPFEDLQKFKSRIFFAINYDGMEGPPTVLVFKKGNDWDWNRTDVAFSHIDTLKGVVDITQEDIDNYNMKVEEEQTYIKYNL